MNEFISITIVKAWYLKYLLVILVISLSYSLSKYGIKLAVEIEFEKYGDFQSRKRTLLKFLNNLYWHYSNQVYNKDTFPHQVGELPVEGTPIFISIWFIGGKCMESFIRRFFLKSLSYCIGFILNFQSFPIVIRYL